MADKGFLENLGVGSVDERALARQARLEQRDNFRALGLGARRGLGAIAGGIGGLLSGKTDGEASGRSFKGLLSNIAGGAEAMEDIDAAQAAGISLEDLNARREIRKVLGSEQYQPLEGESDLDTRERMARRAAEIAAASGSPALQAQALSSLTALREERKQFEKQNAEQRQLEQDIVDDSIKTGWYADGKNSTGVLSQQLVDGKLAWGLEMEDGAGSIMFQPFGKSFSLEDPNAGTTKETPDQRMRKAFGKGHVDETRSMVQANAQAMRKIGRVVTSVGTYVEAGIDEAVLGNSGKFITWLDNGVRNIRGTLRAFMPIGQEKGSAATIDREADPEGRRGGRQGDGWSGWNSWYSRAADADDGIWNSFQLPEWARGVSAEAQEHRAQILELAYMAARLAEPSNRGLSDKDIEAALARIAGDTSNPQQLLRRFMSIAADAAFDLEDRLASYKEAIPGISDEQVDRYFGGRLLEDYRERRTALFDQMDVEFDPNGRPIFESVVDTQFDTEGNLQTPGTVSIENLAPEEAEAVLNDILLLEEPE